MEKKQCPLPFFKLHNAHRFPRKKSESIEIQFSMCIISWFYDNNFVEMYSVLLPLEAAK